MASDIINKNTPKGVGADNRAEVPSAYQIKKFDCINKDGARFDLSNLVTSFTITEDLLSPVIVLNLKIRDNINFFEDFALNGQEVIELSIDHITQESQLKTISLSFNVKEYPDYVKSAENPNVQEYSIIAVSKHGYNSMLQRISRSVKGNPINEIKKIFKNDLGQDVDINGVCSSMFDGIITIQTPLKAIEWLRNKAFDSLSSPFFTYSTISDSRIKISALSKLWSSENKIFRKYYYRQFIKNPANTNAAYQENATRIIDMKSNISLDKLKQAISGGFASVTKSTDIASKTFIESEFKFPSDNNFLSLGSVSNLFSKNSKIRLNSIDRPKSLNELSNASITNLETNSNANYQGNQNSSGVIQTNLSSAKTFYANMEAVSHQVIVYGDFLLNPGKKISIKIPKAVNNDKYNIQINKTNNEELDLALSGDYIVGVVSHSFSEGIYTSKLKIIKDS